MLEKEILQGKLKQGQSPQPNFTYLPQGQKDDLPLHLTSSLVTELSPLILLLKQRNDYRWLILEEPEAHLHLVYLFYVLP